MIRSINLQKSFGNLSVLKGIDLEIKRGEMVAITGASGAGKTTLLQLLGTLDFPTQGEVIIDGINVSALKGNKLANFRNEKIGFVFQFHHLLPEFTALENVCIPGWIRKQKSAELETRAKELLRFLSVDHRIKHKPSEMSGGEQQRVAVARALINNPKIVMADEPTGNLDSKNAKELNELFFKLRDKFDQTFMIVTHNEQLAQSCDRIIQLKDGQILQSL
ncbi:MAG: ABC transporter ATP-binding protein [Flavobacteriales bacterium]|nr:ABC transporter ATP-binding protein [Flavobacteriales bacterium]